MNILKFVYFNCREWYELRYDWSWQLGTQLCHAGHSPQFKYIMNFLMTRCIFHRVRVYNELAKCSAPRWLDSSVGWVLYRYRRGHEFDYHSGLNFFRLKINFTTAKVVYITAMINHIFMVTTNNTWKDLVTSKLGTHLHLSATPSSM